MVSEAYRRINEVRDNVQSRSSVLEARIREIMEGMVSQASAIQSDMLKVGRDDGLACLPGGRYSSMLPVLTSSMCRADAATGRRHRKELAGVCIWTCS